MSRTTGSDHSTLGWVKKELDETLRQAADALENYTEDPGDDAQLRFCATHLHQVHGILQMLELFGAALLAEEMEDLAQALLADQVGNRNEAYEVLMRAMLQLPDYLERIQGGLQDVPVVLLPLLNDLRAARGASLLTENAFFAPDLQAGHGRPRQVERGAQELAGAARKLRQKYQLGLLNLLREQAPDRALQQMAEVLEQLDRASRDDQAGALWWVAAGLVEALELGALESSPTAKTLLAQVDRQIKRAIDQGETALAVEPPRELLKNLLYYVGRAEARGERIPQIQAQYDLKSLLLDEQELASARDGIGGPNAEILETVAGAIGEDMAAVKDGLDLMARAGEVDPERLDTIADSLKRIADTLGVLGLGAARKVVKEQVDVIHDLRDGELALDEPRLMKIAEALLYVESALAGLTGRSAAAGEEAAELDQQGMFEQEFRRVFDETLGQAAGEVAEAKEAIVRYIEDEDATDLDAVPAKFANIRGALRLLNLRSAAAVVAAAERYLRDKLLDPQAMPGAEDLDHLADSITSIEYYLEALREQRAQPERILDVARSGLEQLGYAVAEDPPEPEPPLPAASEPAVAVEAPLAGPATEPAEESELEPDLELEAVDDLPFVAEPEAPAESEPAAPEPLVEAAPAEPAVGRAAVKPPGRIDHQVPEIAEELDDEILEIFLEEADEVLPTLAEEFPKWRRNGEDREALMTTRRLFHTLKGSGRLAGALLLGELAWVCENLLNRVLERTLEADDPRVHEVVQRSLEAVPQLIAGLRDHTPLSTDVRAIMAYGEALADPSRHDELQALESAMAEPPAAEAAAEPAPSDVPDDEPLAVEGNKLPAEEPAGLAVAAADDAPAEEAWDWDLTLESEPAEQIDPDAAAERPLEEIELGLPEAEPEASGYQEAPDADPEAIAAAVDEAEPETAEEIELTALPDVADADVAAEDDGEAGDEPMLDPVLYDIFSNETHDHLQVVAAFLAACPPEGGPASEELVRALHTLTGSARMADIEPIARVGRAMEQHCNAHRDAHQPLAADSLAALRQGAGLIEALVDALGRAGSQLPDVESFLQALAEQPVGGGDEPSDPPAVAELPAEDPPADQEADPALDAEPAPAARDEVDQDLVDLFLEEAQDILKFLETTVERWEEEPDHGAAIAELHRSLHTLKGGARLAGFGGIGSLCHVLEGVSGDVAEHRVPADDAFFNLLHEALDRVADLVAAARAGRTPQAPTELVERIVALRGIGTTAADTAEAGAQAPADEELMAVFLEEAAEILEATEAQLHRWSDEPQNLDLITELQRALHTLKGGARMAGFAPIADLSHALETLLVEVQNGAVAVAPELFDLLEQVHDRLFGLREKAAANQALPAAPDLLAAIEALRRGEGQATPAPAGAESVGEQPEVPVAEEAAASAPAAQPKAPAAEQARPEESRGGQDVVRVRADLLDNLVNYAGEVSIYRARLEQQVGAFGFNLRELDQTVNRLREQLRTMEIETETQILYRFERENEGEQPTGEEFDPLELDRFSGIQEMSRALSESVNDLVSIQSLLDHLARESETLLLQQSRVNTELQDGLMRTRMVPFANLVPRMRRIVRQTAQELDKQAQIQVRGAQGEMDRTVLERMVPPLEHMLRNAIAHGIEAPDRRRAAGKPEAGAINVAFAREGADVVVRVSDDGAGMNLDAIRRKAVDRGLMPENAPLSDREVMQFVLESGFSTAEQVNQIAGRGVGMDVVNAEIKQLGGSLEIDSSAGQGTTFTVRLPFTLALNQALLCQAGEEIYAIPLSSIEGVVRMSHEELEQSLQHPEAAAYEYAGQHYDVRSLAVLLGAGDPVLPGPGKRAPLILVQSGDHRVALQVDGLLGNREIVVKSVGAQISTVPGIFGATILADGRVVLILEVSALVRLGITQFLPEDGVPGEEAPLADERGKPLVMVVDDSITMRKVATRLLERNGMDVVTAKDGVDAVAQLQESVPDAMLLDIEMPRMDGYELATHMRNDSRLKTVPIIMITSRTGEKHRQRALEIGVNRYLGKPYQESELLENLQELLEERRGGQRAGS